MDAQWIAVGNLEGEIQVINRKNLKVEKVYLILVTVDLHVSIKYLTINNFLHLKSLFGGDKLICVKLTENYLISVTLFQLKVWKKDSWVLVIIFKL
jgi:hypothetical protein